MLNKTKSQIEAKVLTKNAPILRDTVKTYILPVDNPEPPRNKPFKESTLNTVSEKKDDKPQVSHNPVAPEIETQTLTRVSFTLDEKTMDKLDQVKKILSGANPQGVDLKTVFANTLESFLEKNCPQRRQKRREERSAKKAEAKAPVRTKPPVVKQDNINKKRPTIPLAAKDAVLKQHDYRCGFVGTDGKRCDSTFNLHIDHIVPLALGGRHDPSNFRILCQSHNLHAAKNMMGESFIERKVGARC